MKKSTLETITKAVKALKYDDTRYQIDSVANIYKDDDKTFMVCTNGVVLCHLELFDDGIEEGNYFVRSIFRTKGAEWTHEATDNEVDYHLEKRDTDYLPWRKAIPTKFDSSKPRDYVSFTTRYFEQALKAVKVIGLKSWTLKYASFNSPAKLINKDNDNNYVIIMPCRLG